MHSTIQYRAIFDIKQVGNQVSFSGLVRTSAQMEEPDDLIVSLNYKRSFDLDYEKVREKETYFESLKPCYKINEESISG